MESILSHLSSQLKINSNEPNKNAAGMCLENPSLLSEIAANLNARDKKLAGDCAEIMTETALVKPSLAAEYSEALLPLLKHKETRVRWEAMHSIALFAALKPGFIESIIPEIREIINKDKSVIVRDYATDAISAYASTSLEAASKAFPVLKEVLEVWSDRHAGRVMEGLMNVYKMKPELKSEIKAMTEVYKDSGRGVVKKAVLKLHKLLEK